MGIMDHVLNNKAEMGRKRKAVKCTLFEARKTKVINIFIIYFHFVFVLSYACFTGTNYHKS